jgi:hypothetical protein
VKSLNVIEYISPCFVPGTVPAMVNPFAFEQAEEPFAGGVIAAVTHGTHAADQSVLAKKPLVVAAREPAAAIGM